MVQETQPLVERPASQELLQDSSYAQTDRNCDVIMKGGITSGVAYPLAVCELARTYRLRSIGGASAGAIAAAGAAAAELGRQRLQANQPAEPVAIDAAATMPASAHGQPRWRQGFAGLAQLPLWIGGQGNLVSLFQPQGETKSLFNLLIAVLGEDKGWPGRIVQAGLREFPGSALLGALPGGMLLLSALFAGGFHLFWGLLCALILVIVGPTLTVGLAVYRVLAVKVPANRFGICSGLDGERQGNAVPLTAADYLDALAGKAPNGHPLTFGDLWGGPEVRSEERNVDLQMMTTCLTLGRPFRLPFESQRFMFRESDFTALFPKRVVQWMIEKSKKVDDADPDETASSAEVDRRIPPGFYPMPSAANLPVVVAARMSLSFPVLFSAVPLYAVDFSRRRPAATAFPEPCWFSDGGITSNLPVHFFDQPLPRWPTFAINLRGQEVGVVSSTDERENVYFPRATSEVSWEGWTRYPIDIASHTRRDRALARAAGGVPDLHHRHDAELDRQRADPSGRYE